MLLFWANRARKQLYYLAATYVGSTSKTKLLIANHTSGPQPNLSTRVGVIKKQEIKVWFTLSNCYLKCSSWSTNRWMTIPRGSKWNGLNVDEKNTRYHHDQMIIIFNFESLGHVCAMKAKKLALHTHQLLTKKFFLPHPSDLLFCRNVKKCVSFCSFAHVKMLAPNTCKW